MVATVDLGTPTEIRSMGINVLESTRVGVLLPVAVEFSVSEDGEQFRTLKTVTPEAATGHSEPRTATVMADELKARARYVRVGAANTGTLPDWLRKEPTKAWLFVDELWVNLGEGDRGG